MSFETQQNWEAWLKEHHADTKGLWLKIAKKDTGIPSVSYAEALECALCYGWIDGQKASFDDTYWLQKFTPRGRKSRWSQVNCDKVTALMASGRMQPVVRASRQLARCLVRLSGTGRSSCDSVGTNHATYRASDQVPVA